MLTRVQLQEIADTMKQMFPDAHCELTHQNPFELVVAVALSAQATDALVNKVTPGLFEAFPTVEAMATAEVSEIETLIKRIGLYRNKAKNVKALSEKIVNEHDGIVPSDRTSLEALPGVGRKTANVVLSVAFHEPAFAVDTHVERVSKRLGICRWKDNVRQVEETLMKKFPRDEWSQLHHQFIFFGRYHCKAQRPACETCPLLHMCREGKKRMKSTKVTT
ncbi:MULTISPECIES: endonuclease III [Exiguobacterium]|uniref:Endonuclease III n=1 Tax=Exiguobacterium marinum TaxID=273528 RepID=A0ABY7X1W9_9BACL|nr:MULTISPECIES: endonuclease III [Exiguobacterium]WDH77107.1 endonuclease III [Exiguobacterium marinum]